MNGGDRANARWAYYCNPNAIRIELVSRDIEPLIAMLWS